MDPGKVAQDRMAWGRLCHNMQSVPIPENAERRATITRGIQAVTRLDEDGLERLIRSFYDTACRDSVIGHQFDDVVG
jgi:hypothetical protein